MGMGMIIFELYGKAEGVRVGKKILNISEKNQSLVVVLTAYNDEESIGPSVENFLSHGKVEKVIVVSNNSTDKTYENAKKAGATVFNEPKKGYGHCVYRCLSEGIKFKKFEYTVLCEGDQTFDANDIDKFLAYSKHADFVVGSRTSGQLQNGKTQLSTFMNYGNYFVGKLLEFKYLGRVNLTDVGTTFKICRNSALKELLPHLDPTINLSFNPYFLDTALSRKFTIIEIPVSFHSRIGESKGGNKSNFIALKLGLKMIYGITCRWTK
jgi:glycosyltransferase involved in cell wall biosynthesis